MSRSYRRPYASCCGVNSAKEDKRHANRAVRRLQKQYIRTNADNLDFLLPHRYEAAHNDVRSWIRDGKQVLQLPDARTWGWYCSGILKGYHQHTWEEYIAWYAEYKRK